MGLRGKQLVSREYSWGKIAAKVAALYRCSLSGGAKPDSIVN